MDVHMESAEFIKMVDSRVLELERSLVSVQNNANAHIGAIQELKRLKDSLLQITEPSEEVKKE